MCAVPIPDNVSDEQAILVGDVLGTGYHSVVEGGVVPGDSVAVFGCGPVGLSALASLQLFGPARVFAIDVLPNRLALAEFFGAEIIDASKTDPVSEILDCPCQGWIARGVNALHPPLDNLSWLCWSWSRCW